jgi:gluconokinase
LTQSDYILTVDLGTSSIKTIGYSLSGEIVFRYSSQCTILRPDKLICEQDPDVLFTDTLQALRKAVYDVGNPKAIVFSCAMHGLIAIDKKGVPLTNLITWADNRSFNQLEDLKSRDLGARLFNLTGTPLHTMSPLLKVKWIKENEPDIFSKTEKFVSLKEYIIYRLTGHYYIDFSLASATGFFNIHNFTWEKKALDFAGISESLLSQPVEIFYSVSDWDQTVTGASPGKKFPIIIGSSDGCLANYGAGAFTSDVPALTLGTSGALRVISDKPIEGASTGLFSYILERDRYVCGGPVNNAGILFKWYSKVFGDRENSEDQIFSDIDRLISATKPGADGLICLPYLLGERAPVWNPLARGVFAGVDYNHSREHFLRAIAEGMIMNLYQIAEPLITRFGAFSKLKAGGGVVRCRTILQIIADVFNVEVEISDDHDHSNYGAFLVAYRSLYGKEFQKEEIISESVQPDSENVKIYTELFGIFKGIYSRHEEDYVKINNLLQKLP